MTRREYNFKVIQTGSVPLTVDGRVAPFAEHQCTSTLIWPRDEPVRRDNSMLVDPCFSARGYRKAKARLMRLDCTFNDIGAYFVTHDHRDHLVHFPDDSLVLDWNPFSPETRPPFGEVETVHCPGHHPELTALQFQSDQGRTQIVSDAVINREWLTKWAYYWPNQYGPEDIAMTWRSVARILVTAEFIVPGHGPGFEVNVALLEEMLENWPTAQEAEACPDVERALLGRLEECRAE